MGVNGLLLAVVVAELSSSHFSPSRLPSLYPFPFLSLPPSPALNNPSKQPIQTTHLRCTLSSSSMPVSWTCSGQRMSYYSLSVSPSQ